MSMQQFNIQATKESDDGVLDILKPEIILGPLDDCKADESTSTLLVLAPGAFLIAEDYRKLACALQEAVKERVRLVVGIVDIDWSCVTQGNAVDLVAAGKAAIDRVCQQADSWLPLKPGPTGRRENVILAAHSVMGPPFVRTALEQAGGLMLLGSQMLPQISNTFPTASTWTRPILYLTGELDGQQLISKQAFAVADAADNAARLSLNHVAAFQPIIFVPGMSHMQFGPPQERMQFPGQQPADLTPDISHDDAVRKAAAVMADFLAAHRSASADEKQAATEALQSEVVSSGAIVGPLLNAAGRGHVESLLNELQSDPFVPQPDKSRASGLIPRSFGGEVQPGNGQWLAHPGELAAAESFAVDLQRKAVEQLPAGMQQRVVVVATSHTDEATFLYNQPTITPVPGGRVLLRCHVYLWRHFLQTLLRVQPAVSPEYAFKLKTASAIARALGEDAEAEKQLHSNLDIAAINDQTLQDALAVVPEATRERYERRGKKWTTTLRPVESPLEWVQKEHVTFTDTSATYASAGTTEVSLPWVCTQRPGEAVQKLSNYASGQGRFVGNHYMKMLSPARAIEWLMIDALRPQQQKPRPQLS